MLPPTEHGGMPPIARRQTGFFTTNANHHYGDTLIRFGSENTAERAVAIL